MIHSHNPALSKINTTGTKGCYFSNHDLEWMTKRVLKETEVIKIHYKTGSEKADRFKVQSRLALGDPWVTEIQLQRV